MTYTKTEITIMSIIFILGSSALAWYGLQNAPGSPSGQKQVEVDSVTWKEVEMNVSAYCPCSKCCGDWSDGITASGVKAKGKLIAAPSNYPFGTVMDVPGYGIAEVQDRGGAIKGNKLDLLFPTHEEALKWGRQYITVKVRQ